MREKCVVLKHHRCAAPDRRQADDVFTVDPHFTGGRRFVAGDHAQNCCLAASARSQQAAIGTRRDLQVDAVDRHRFAEVLGAVDKFDFPGLTHERLRSCLHGLLAGNALARAVRLDDGDRGQRDGNHDE